MANFESLIHLFFIFSLIVFTGLPLSLLFFNKTFILKYLTIPFNSIVFLVLFVTLFSHLGIMINSSSILIILVLSITLTLILYFRNKHPSILTTEKKVAFLFVLIMFSIHLFFRLKPTLYFYTPPLHDPISHSFWAKEIIEKGTLTQFYSPGLHILAASVEILKPYNIPQTISFITNFYLSYLFLSTYVMFYCRRESNFLSSLIVAIIGSIFTYPSMLFYTSGKNAYILGLSLLPIIIYITDNYREKFRILLLVFSLYTLSMVHYPLFLFAFLYYIINIFYQLFISKSNIKFLIRELVLVTISVFILIFLYVFPKWSIVGNGDAHASLASVSIMDIINPGYIFNSLIITINRFLIYNGWDNLLYVSLIILLLGINILKGNNKYILWIMSILIVVDLFGSPVPILRKFNVISGTGVILSGIVVIFGIYTAVVNYISSLKIKEQILILVWIFNLFIFYDYRYYHMYIKKQINFNPVTLNDIEAFLWLDDHYDQNIVLNHSYLNERRGIVFPDDTAMWLEVYTDNYLAMSFLNFSSNETKEIYSYYQEFLMDPDNDSVLRFFDEKNIELVFYKENSSSNLDLSKIMESKNYNKVYEKGGISIFEIESS